MAKWDLRGDCNLPLDNQVREGRKLEIVAFMKSFGEGDIAAPCFSPLYMARNWTLCFPEKALKLYDEAFAKMKDLEKLGKKK